jgi:hypothetical protein
MTLQKSIIEFKRIGESELVRNLSDLNRFDEYILGHFYDGITTYSEEIMKDNEAKSIGNPAGNLYK